MSFNSTDPVPAPPLTNAIQLPAKPEKEEAIRITDIYNGNQTELCPLSFEKFCIKKKARSDAYNRYSFLCYLNTAQDAGWLVFRYAEKGTCQMSSAVRQFNSRTGGTSTLKQHTEDHERSKKRNVLGFPFKLQKTDKAKVVQAAARAVIFSDLPFTFAEGKGMFQFAKAVFEASRGCAPGTNIDIQDLMHSRQAIRKNVQVIADKEREKFSQIELKQALLVGGAVTCDGLKQKVNGTKFYDLIIHFIQPGLEQPNDGFNNVKMISRVLLLRENKGCETAVEINSVLEEVMRKSVVFHVRI